CEVVDVRNTKIQQSHQKFLVYNTEVTPSLLHLPTPRNEEKMYKGQSGMWSWLFHRITGFAILIFLFIHIVDISLLSFGPEIYNDGIAFFDSIIARLLSLGLIVAIIYHACNGIRIICIDFWRKGARYQKVMFTIVLVATVI